MTINLATLSRLLVSGLGDVDGGVVAVTVTVDVVVVGEVVVVTVVVAVVVVVLKSVSVVVTLQLSAIGNGAGGCSDPRDEVGDCTEVVGDGGNDNWSGDGVGVVCVGDGCGGCTGVSSFGRVRFHGLMLKTC